MSAFWVRGRGGTMARATTRSSSQAPFPALFALGVAFLLGACAPRAPLVETSELSLGAPRNGILRVVDFNAWGVPFRHAHGQLLGRLAEELRKLHPDIVTLQEVWFEEDAELLAGALRQNGLTHVQHRSTDEVMAYDSSGLVIASRYPITAVAFHQFHAGRSPTLPWHPDWFSGKGVLLATIETPGGPVDVATLHLHADYDGASYRDVRMAQAVEAATFLHRRFAAPLRILAGDFNGESGDVEVRLLRAATGVRPLIVDDVDGILVGGPAPWPLIASGRTLRTPVTIAGESLRLSDHAGLFVDLATRTGTATRTADAPARLPAGLRAEVDEHLMTARGAEVRLQGLLAMAILSMVGALLWLRSSLGRAHLQRHLRLTAMSLLAVGILALGHQLLWMSPSRKASLDDARSALVRLAL